MEYILVALLIGFLLFFLLEAKQKAAKLQVVIDEEKSDIATESGMTASIGVFYPDSQTTVIIGASEELGAFYYRMLRQGKLNNRSKINIANLVKIELLLNGHPYDFAIESDEATTSLKSSDIANKVVNNMSSEGLNAIQRAALRINFVSEGGSEKTLDITSLRTGDERYRFQRVQMLKNSIWWVSFLNLSSRNARRVVRPQRSENE